MFNKSKGFTLIELMIVVAIIGILAAVAIPKFADMLEKAREGATKGNVGAIKSAISIYYGDNMGSWPGSLDNYFNNYMDKLPPVKVTHPGTGAQLAGTNYSHTVIATAAGTAPVIATNTDGWLYNKLTGDLWVNNSQTDTRGLFYSTYGYE